MGMRLKSGLVQAAGVVLLGMATAAVAQKAPGVTGSVKATGDHSVTITTKAGTDLTIAVPDDAKVLQIAPGSTSLSGAATRALTDLAPGDRVLITGTVGDAPDALHATRVVLMKSSAIAETRAAEEAAWQHGGGGLVKSVDKAGSSLLVASGTHDLTVKVTPATTFKRYSGSSVRFEDAIASTFADVKPGDQLRVRGKKSDDGSSMTADAIVTGSFRNFSGLLTAVDGTAGTVTLKDLATKKTVVVKVSSSSDVRRIPPQAAARFAARSAGTPVGSAGTTAGSSGAAASGPGGSARAGSDLSQMLSRLPTETLGGLKVGDAVMIVAMQPEEGEPASAVTLLAGVEPILQASPKGETTLTPWSMGGGGAEAGGVQ